ncbi:chromosome condensation protein CrcB [Arthrobacter sp. SW1]|uniref:fluoride efflux transporter CrcB n=1 Tax=Arthrobacter sp. SW1 TaxID=1920889 RepID=UPI000877D2AD|nr:fluoride efflux transporter CrcB [Arthrobacter sp. SW1]OFI39975.1 chromosome condensation protein CrcB [Arthrobacter sp. SW1]
MTVFLMALAGGAGAAARFLVDGLVRTRFRTALPWGTILINVSGSLLLGLLAGLVLRNHAAPQLQLVLGTGFLGGYTTFSTASVETARLLQSGRAGLALFNALGTMVAGAAAAAAGLALAGLA